MLATCLEPCRRVPASSGLTLFSRIQKNMAHVMVDYEVGANEPLPEDYLEPVKALWLDGGVQQVIVKGNEFALHDNLA